MKRAISFLIIFCMAFALCAVVYGDEFGGTVTFDGEKLVSDYGSPAVDLTDALKAMQPGDDLTITIKLVNKNDEKGNTDWYMTNRTLESFEDKSKALGGIYSYTLTYTTPAGKTVTIYNSGIVGGERAKDLSIKKGLHEATVGLEEYFFVGTLKQNETGVVKLHVKLDGETQGNIYQDTDADITLNFAVETRAAKTGDETRIAPYLIVTGVSGLAMLICSIVLIALVNKRERRGKTI